MIDGSRAAVRKRGELLFIPAPNLGEIARCVQIKVIDVTHQHTVINLDEPPVQEPPGTCSGDEHLEVWYGESLGGELEGPSIW